MVYTGSFQSPVQTGYFVHPPTVKPGLIEFPGLPHSILSFPVESDFILAGTGVVKGTPIEMPAAGWGSTIAPFTVKDAAGAVADGFVGVLVWDAASRNDASGRAGKRRNDMAGVIASGYVGVKLFDDPAAAGAPAFLVVDAGNSLNAPVGSWASSELSGAAVAIPGASFWAGYSAARDGYGILKLA